MGPRIVVDSGLLWMQGRIFDMDVMKQVLIPHLKKISIQVNSKCSEIPRTAVWGALDLDVAAATMKNFVRPAERPPIKRILGYYIFAALRLF